MTVRKFLLPIIPWKIWGWKQTYILMRINYLLNKKEYDKNMKKSYTLDGKVVPNSSLISMDEMLDVTNVMGRDGKTLGESLKEKMMETDIEIRVQDLVQDAILLLDNPDMGGTNFGKALRKLRQANRLLHGLEVKNESENQG